MLDADTQTAQFDAEHGAYEMDPKTYYLIFEDGAVRSSGVGGGLIMLQPPPEDAAERQQYIVHYWKLKKAKADRAFQELKQHLVNASTPQMSAGDYSVPPPQSELDKLTELRDLCRVVNTALTEAEAKLPDLDPDKARSDAHNLYLREKNEKYQEAVMAIRV